MTSQAPMPELEGNESRTALLTSPPPKPGTPSKVDRLLSAWRCIILDSWFPEAFALSLSLGCLITIFAILQAYSNKAPPSLSFGLSLNSIVSVLSTASKSSLIYVVAETVSQLKWTWFRKRPRQLQGLQTIDYASRGPWGSLTVLFHRSGRSLVSLGAMITLLALAFDPFMQQIISYPIRQTSHITNSTLAKQARVILPPSDDNKSFLNALDAGFWMSDFDLTPTCPTGNCTWPPFRSMGFCSKCEDVTSQATLDNCKNVTLSTNITQTTDTPCNVTLPYGDSSREPIHVSPLGRRGNLLMELPVNLIWQIGVLGQGAWSFMSGREDKPKNELVAFAHASLRVSNNHSKGYSHPEDSLQISNVTKCAISFCSREYNVSMSNGIVSIELSEPDWGEIFTHKYNSGDEGLVSYDDKVCWKSGHGGSHNVTPVNVTSDFVTSDTFANASEFSFCPDTDTYSQISTTFTGTTFEEWSRLNESSSSLWTYLQNGDDDSSDNIRKILTTSLEEVTTNVAASLTKYALQRSNSTIVGNVSAPETYVAVDWRWFSLPAILLLSTIGLFISTIWVNKAEGIQLWKSSILPALYHGLEPESLLDSHDLGTVSTMEGAAQGTDVKLQHAGETGRLMLR